MIRIVVRFVYVVWFSSSKSFPYLSSRCNSIDSTNIQNFSIVKRLLVHVKFGVTMKLHFSTNLTLLTYPRRSPHPECPRAPSELFSPLPKNPSNAFGARSLEEFLKDFFFCISSCGSKRRIELFPNNYTFDFQKYMYTLFWICTKIDLKGGVNSDAQNMG